MKRQFNLFLCTDVLIYVGDCSELFSLVQRASMEKSRFILSTEKQEETGYSLSKSGRYTHSKNYIIDCAERFGFKFIDDKEVVLRKKTNGFVIGDIFLFEKRAVNLSYPTINS